MLDLLLGRYSDIGYLMTMEASQGVQLILKAIEKSNEERLFTKWLHDDARYQLSFEEYLASSKPYRKSTDQEKDYILKKWGGTNGIV